MKTYGIDQDTAKALKPCVSFRKLSDTVFDALHDVSVITLRVELLEVQFSKQFLYGIRQYCFPAQNRNVRIQS